MNTEVGVLIPVWNGANTLDACLDSLARQALADFTALIVDDGSSDDTPNILRRWAERDDRFRVLTRPHLGLVPALNAGLEALETPLIARLDADDIALPERLEQQRNRLSDHPEEDLVACRYAIRSGSPVGAGSEAYRDWQNGLLTHEEIVRNLYVESPMSHPTVMFRRNVALALGGYRDMEWVEDYDLWLRMAQSGTRFSKLPEELVEIGHDSGRLTWTDPRCRVESFFRCKGHFLARDPRVRDNPVLIIGAGIAAARLGRALLAEGAEVAAFLEVDPRKIGGEKRGRPVVSWDEGFDRWPGHYVLVAVGAREVREGIRTALNGRGLVEEREYLFAA